MIRSDTRHLDRRRRHQGRASCEVTGRRFEVQGSAPIYMLATRLWVHGHGGADYEVYDDRCVGRMSRMNEKVDWNSMAAQRGHTKSGGRQKGTPNRVTAEIKAAFRKHGDELVDALMALTKSADERVRLGAIQAAVARPGLGQGRAGRGPRRGGGDHQDRAQDRGSDEARVLTLPSARSARASGAVLRPRRAVGVDFDSGEEAPWQCGCRSAGRRFTCSVTIGLAVNRPPSFARRAPRAMSARSQRKSCNTSRSLGIVVPLWYLRKSKKLV